jgi:transcriptional regulator with XRE-family HTH domain
MPRSTRTKTGVERFFDEQMKLPSFAESYTDARAAVDAIDSVVRALDAARQKCGLTKAELAGAIDARPEVVRRLFTTKTPNPTLSTIIRLAAAVGYRVELVRDARPKKARRPLTKQRGGQESTLGARRDRNSLPSRRTPG